MTITKRLFFITTEHVWCSFVSIMVMRCSVHPFSRPSCVSCGEDKLSRPSFSLHFTYRNSWILPIYTSFSPSLFFSASYSPSLINRLKSFFSLSACCIIAYVDELCQQTYSKFIVPKMLQYGCVLLYVNVQVVVYFRWANPFIWANRFSISPTLLIIQR